MGPHGEKCRSKQDLSGKQISQPIEKVEESWPHTPGPSGPGAPASERTATGHLRGSHSAQGRGFWNKKLQGNMGHKKL